MSGRGVEGGCGQGANKGGPKDKRVKLLFMVLICIDIHIIFDFIRQFIRCKTIIECVHAKTYNTLIDLERCT